MGCSTSGSREVLPRAIPGPPSYLQPVIVPEPVLDQQPVDIAAIERAGRIQANRIIAKARAEWNKMVADFAQGN